MVIFAAEYRYSGPNFDEFNGSYSSADRVTGSFTTASLLPDSMVHQDITALVTSYQFTDGKQTFTEANSSMLTFAIGTDSRGNPATWAITLWETPITSTFGGSVNVIETFFTTGESGFSQEFGWQDGVCGNTAANVCISAASNGTNSGSFNAFTPNQAQGSWQGGRPQLVPTLSWYSLLVLLLCMVSFAYFRLNKYKQ